MRKQLQKKLLLLMLVIFSVSTLFAQSTVSLNDFKYKMSLREKFDENYKHPNADKTFSKRTKEAIFSEDFTDGQGDWTFEGDQTDGWGWYNTNYAGGAAPEILLYPGGGTAFDGTSMLLSPEINTEDKTELALQFKYYVYAKAEDSQFEVRTTSDGGTTWNVIYSENLNNKNGAELKTLVFSNSDIGSTKFQLAFCFVGNSNKIQWLGFDDIALFEPKNKDVAVLGLATYPRVVVGTEREPKVSVKNNGIDTVDCDVNMTIYTQTDEAVYSEKVTKELNGLEEYEIVMPSWGNFVEGEYKISLSVEIAADEDLTNNQVSSTIAAVDIENKAYVSLPFSSDEYPDGTGILDLDNTEIIPYEKGSFLDNSGIAYGGDFGPDGNWYLALKNGLYSVDTVTGENKLAMSLTNSYWGIAYSVNNGVIYANYNNVLYKINIHTGEEERIGNYLNAENMLAIAMNKDGKLYGVDVSNLYSINIETGEATIIGAHGYSLYYGNSIAFDRNKEKLYLAGYAYAGSYSTPFAEFNLETGVATEINTLPTIAVGLSIKPNVVISMGSITGTVSNSADEFIENARVWIKNEAGFETSALTNENGEYEFTFIPVGNYKLVSEAKYYDKSDTVDVTVNTTTANASFILTIAQTKVTFTVLDFVDETAHNNAQVLFYGDTVITDASGIAVFENIPDGVYEYSAIKDGYYGAQGEISVQGEDVAATVKLIINKDIERNLVIGEKATGTWCVFCPAAATGFETLLENEHSVALLAYHGGDDYETTATASRINYYGITNFPTAVFDGVNEVSGGGSAGNSMYDYYAPIVDQAATEKTPVGLEIVNAVYNEETKEFTADIDVEAIGVVVAEKTVLHVALTQSRIEEEWYLSSLEFVVRDMFNGAEGTVVDLSTMENKETVSVTFTLKEEWGGIPSHFEVVAFVQDVDSKYIFNGDKVYVEEPHYYDVTFVAIDSETQETITKGKVNFHDEYRALTDTGTVYRFIEEATYEYSINAFGYLGYESTLHVVSDTTITVELESDGNIYLFHEDFDETEGFPGLPEGWVSINEGASNYLYTFADVEGRQVAFFRQNATNDTLILMTPKLGLETADSLFVDAYQGAGMPNLAIGYATDANDVNTITILDTLELDVDKIARKLDLKDVFTDSIHLVFQYATGGEAFEFFYIDNVIVTGVNPASDNAKLSSITLSEGALEPEFASDIYTYTVNLPDGTTNVPTVNVTVEDENASFEINATTAIPGTTTIVVTAEDGETKLTYTLDFAVGVNFAQMANVKIYPNPVKDEVNFSNINNAHTVKLVSVDGRLISTHSVQSSYLKLSLDSMSKGIYIVQVLFNDGSVFNQRIIKQ